MIYLILLLYLFMGVGTVADCFMNAGIQVLMPLFSFFGRQSRRSSARRGVIHI